MNPPPKDMMWPTCSNVRRLSRNLRGVPGPSSSWVMPAGSDAVATCLMRTIAKSKAAVNVSPCAPAASCVAGTAPPTEIRGDRCCCCANRTHAWPIRIFAEGPALKRSAANATGSRRRDQSRIWRPGRSHAIAHRWRTLHLVPIAHPDTWHGSDSNAPRATACLGFYLVPRMTWLSVSPITFSNRQSNAPAATYCLRTTNCHRWTE